MAVRCRIVILWTIYGHAMSQHGCLLVASGLTSLLKGGFDLVVHDGVSLDVHRCLSVASGLTLLLKVGFDLVVQEGKSLDALCFGALAKPPSLVGFELGTEKLSGMESFKKCLIFC